MQSTVSFRDMPASPSLQAAAERWMARLEQVSDGIIGCHVSVEKPHHRLHGSHISITDQINLDAYVALADAFRAARRRLLDHTDLQRGFVKAPASPAGGNHAGVVASKQ
jgi:adenylate kinase